MNPRKLSLPAPFLYLFGALKYMAIKSLMADLDLELVSCRIAPFPKFISRFAWNDSPLPGCQFEDSFVDVHKSNINYTQGRLFE